MHSYKKQPAVFIGKFIMAWAAIQKIKLAMIIGVDMAREIEVTFYQVSDDRRADHILHLTLLTMSLIEEKLLLDRLRGNPKLLSWWVKTMFLFDFGPKVDTANSLASYVLLDSEDGWPRGRINKEAEVILSRLTPLARKEEGEIGGSVPGCKPVEFTSPIPVARPIQEKPVARPVLRPISVPAPVAATAPSSSGQVEPPVPEPKARRGGCRASKYNPDGLGHVFPTRPDVVTALRASGVLGQEALKKCTLSFIRKNVGKFARVVEAVFVQNSWQFAPETVNSLPSNHLTELPATMTVFLPSGVKPHEVVVGHACTSCGEGYSMTITVGYKT